MVVPSSRRSDAGGHRSRWWLVAAVAGVLLVAAVAASSQLGSNRDAPDTEAEPDGPGAVGSEPATRADASSPGDDVASPEEDAAPAITSADAQAPAESRPPASDVQPTGSGDESGDDLSSAFGEPEHPVPGVEPHVPSRIRLDEPGPPAAVCRGVLPAQRVQLPLRFASTKPEGVDHLSWSPDCRRMVFRVGSTLWVANGDGTGDLPFLTAQNGLNAPVWSPDSQWVAFSQGAIVDGERASHIFMILPDGLGLAQITHGDMLDQDPAWSPDESRIAFARRLWVAAADGSIGFEHRIVVVDLLDGAQQVVSVSAERLSAPSWSPDGQTIAYRVGGGELTRRVGQELRMVHLDDLSESVLLDGVIGGGTWSPDGSAIAAMSKWSDGQAAVAVRSLRDPSTTEEYVVAVEGPAETASGGTPTLRWSETGEHLLFHATDPRGAHWIYRLPVLSQRLR